MMQGPGAAPRDAIFTPYERKLFKTPSKINRVKKTSALKNKLKTKYGTLAIEKVETGCKVAAGWMVLRYPTLFSEKQSLDVQE